MDHKIDNKLVPNIGIYFRVASFLNNAFGQRLQSDKELSYEILQRTYAQKNVDKVKAPIAGQYPIAGQSHAFFANLEIYECVTLKSNALYKP